MMDSDAGSLRNWTASVEDLLAFVDRASKSVTAALKRPSSKPKGRLNLRRYIQKRLNNSQDYVRDRTPAMSKKKKPRTSKFSSSSSLGSNFERSVTPTLQGAESSSQADLICGDFFGSVVPSGNYSWNSNPSLLYGYYNDDSWSASGRTQEGHTGANEANLCDGGNDGGVFRTRDSCQNLSYSSASPDNGGCCMSTSDTPSRQGTNVVCASVVDPVFPPENDRERPCRRLRFQVRFQATQKRLTSGCRRGCGARSHAAS